MPSPLAPSRRATGAPRARGATRTSRGAGLDLGLEVEREPTFPGSDAAETEPFPELQLTYRFREHQLYLGLGELGTKLRLSERTSLVVSAGLEEGRDADEDERLAALDPIDDGVDFGLSLWHRRGPWIVAAQAQTDVGNDKGSVFFLGAAWEREFGDGRWRFLASLDLSGADAEHMRRELGVTAAEAVRSGLLEYVPDGGLKTWTLGLQLDRWWSRWGLLFELEAERYIGEAEDSPLIVELGSKVGVEVSAGFVRRWSW